MGRSGREKKVLFFGLGNPKNRSPLMSLNCRQRRHLIARAIIFDITEVFERLIIVLLAWRRPGRISFS